MPIRFEVAEFVLAEAFVVAAAILAVGLAFASTMRPNAPRVKLLLALLVAALLSKTLANSVQFGPDRALAWLTPGAYGGLALGILSLLAASAAPRAWSARFAVLALSRSSSPSIWCRKILTMLMPSAFGGRASC